MVLDLHNNTPFTCEPLPMTEKNGATILRIVLKAGYEITADGHLQVAAKQPEAIMEDKYWGKPGESSVRYESDITLDQPYTDLIINGHAYAPNGRPVEEMDVYAAYQGRLLKRLHVTGDRLWQKGTFGWSMTSPEPFIKMPIVYDRAYGGSDAKGSEPRNRVGTGYSSSFNNDFEGTPVPNIEFPDQLINNLKDKPHPAGFGVISKNWEPRLFFAGTYDEAWLKDRFPLLPHDFDSRFFQSVAPDQWISRPQGGEIIDVRGMTPDGILRFSLPSCHIDLTLNYTDHTEQKPMDLDNILIESDERRLILTWHASADIHGNPFRLLEMIVGLPSETTSRNCGCFSDI
jgi:hypothetical protein